jgi:FkbM family methyltransferase
MSALRKVLRIKPVNRLARGLGRIVLWGRAYRRFERRLPLLEPFTIALPSGNHIHWTPCGDICSKFLKYDGWNGYERASTELFYALARHAPVTFDVGAYLAYYAFLAAGAHPGNRAWAFEAVPTLAEKCRQLAQQNPQLQVTIVPAAVSNTRGPAGLYLPADRMESDTSLNPGHRPNRTRVEVPGIRLDDFIKERDLDRLDLLKIDTETTEPEVLAGMAEAVARWKPVMLIEVLPEADVSRLSHFLRTNNYACAWIKDEGPIPVPELRPDPEKHLMNYLFYPQNVTSPLLSALHQQLKN